MLKKILGNKVVLKKFLVTILVFLVYRIGCMLTIPGVDSSAIGLDYFSPFGLLNLLGGGSLSKFSLFALGVSPYITSGIIVQLLASSEIIPKLNDWQKDGEKGLKKLEKVTRCLTLLLAILNGIALVYSFNNTYGIMESTTIWNYIFVVTMLVAGTMIVTWLGDCISLHGIGNGISMIIFAGIVSSLPTTVYANFVNLVFASSEQSQIIQGVIHFIIFILIYLVLILCTVAMEGAERHIPIQTRSGLNDKGSNMSFLPIKMNPAGVMPVIFAQTLLTTPAMYMSFINYDLYEKMNEFCSLNTWTGIVTFAILILLFTYIYSSIVFDPEEIAENFKKNGTYILGIRQGKDTEKYINKAVKKSLLLGALSLTVLGALPYVLSMFATVMDTSSLGGNSIVIMVGVALETLQVLSTIQYENKYDRLGFIGNKRKVGA